MRPLRRTVSQSFIASNVNCTKCIGLSLFLWFICVVVFLVRNSSNISSTNLDFRHPFTMNNIPNAQQTKLTSNSNANANQAASYAESLSSELSTNGWKPLYIHVWSARMPVQEMDYLLEKYWHPHIQSNEQQHQTVDNLDIKDLKQKKDKAKSRMIDSEHDEKHQEKLRDAPSTSKSSKSDGQYPSDWKSQCFPDRIYDADCIRNTMQYWSKGVSMIANKREIANKYVTFLKDCGGWNNIRQGFEFHAMVAWVTNRTLVIPPDTPWYLIDFGQITRGAEAKKEANFPAWPENKARQTGVSNYDIWFDLNDLSLAVPVITSSEFIRREFDSLNMPMELSGGDIVNSDKHKAGQFKQWLNQKATELNVNLPWGQLANYLAWPSVDAVQSKNSDMIDSAWIDNRKPREYTAFLQAAKFIHFPSCAKGVPGEDHNYRYLGQSARSIAFDSKQQDLKYKQVLRDHVHLTAQIMEYASLVVRVLGAFNYASFHIRRNELQYKYVFAEATESYQNVRPLLGEAEVLYIATDEKRDDFFKVFEENGKRKVFRWKDFFGADAQFEETKNVQIPAKLHGEVEMAICAMGRIFFGTKESTFSQYIGVLRGYFGAPYTQTLYHHYKLAADVEESSRISKSNPGKPYRGQIYKIPFPDLWEDIKDLP